MEKLKEICSNVFYAALFWVGVIVLSLVWMSYLENI